MKKNLKIIKKKFKKFKKKKNFLQKIILPYKTTYYQSLKKNE